MNVHELAKELSICTPDKLIENNIPFICELTSEYDDAEPQEKEETRFFDLLTDIYINTLERSINRYLINVGVEVSIPNDPDESIDWGCNDWLSAANTCSECLNGISGGDYSFDPANAKNFVKEHITSVINWYGQIYGKIKFQRFFGDNLDSSLNSRFPY